MNLNAEGVPSGAVRAAIGAATQQAFSTAQLRMEEDFAQLEATTQVVEHLTIPGFMRRIPHRFSFDDITRFGDKVGRAAESMHLAYLTTVDSSLGTIRMFPGPLLQRVYQLMASQLGWPQIIDAPAQLGDDTKRVHRETLKAHERLERLLRSVMDAAQNEEVQTSSATLLAWLVEDIARIRAELGETEVAE